VRERIDEGEGFGEIGVGLAQGFVAPLARDEIDELETVGLAGKVKDKMLPLCDRAELAAV
jgi:hypothetical protein